MIDYTGLKHRAEERNGKGNVTTFTDTSTQVFHATKDITDSNLEPRELAPWEQSPDPSKPDWENRLDYLTRFFRHEVGRIAERLSCRNGVLSVESVDAAAVRVCCGEAGSLFSEIMDD